MLKTLPSDAFLIPENATKVFGGKIFDVYQWPQAMFDGSTKTFEMLKRPDTVQVIVARDDEILLVEDEQPGHSVQTHFPGGRADEDNSWLEAAKRELLEETGVSCSDWRLIDVAQPLVKAEWFAPVYLAQNIMSEQAQQLDADGERITVLWRSFEEVRDEVLSGESKMMQYLLPFFNHTKTLQQLLGTPEFKGNEIDR